MLGFLKSVKVQAPEQPVRKSSGVRKQRNPENADLRVFADGSIYPSASLVKRFGLEYGNKPAEDQPTVGFGFDVIDSNQFLAILATPERCLWVSPVARTESKIDLFNTVKYNEDGTPNCSVLEQGSKTFGEKVLIPLLKEAYGVEFTDDKRHVDLKFYGVPQEDGTEAPFTLPNGKTIAFIPKSVQRGENKGTETVVRRENPSFWCLHLAEVQEESGANVEEEGEEPEVPSTAEMAAAEKV